MPKVDLTHEEIDLIVDAIYSEVKSAKRAQNSGKTPQIKEIYRQHETTMSTLGNKLIIARAQK